MPGYFLNDFDLAMDVLAEIDAPNLFLQFDAYHAAKIIGDVLGTWDKVRARTAHIQVGGVPDRAEPTGGGVISIILRSLKPLINRSFRAG